MFKGLITMLLSDLPGQAQGESGTSGPWALSLVEKDPCPLGLEHSWILEHTSVSIPVDAVTLCLPACLFEEAAVPLENVETGL